MLPINPYYRLRKLTKDYRTIIRRHLSPHVDIIESKVDIINWLGQQHNYTSYLQISTYTTGGFYDRIDSGQYSIKACLNYLPENGIFDGLSGATHTGDHTFRLQAYDDALLAIRENYPKFDVVFVDSFHTFEQSNTDLINALSLLNHAGTIVVHDCYPRRQKDTGNTWTKGTWLGQTYASFIQFRAQHPYMETAVVDIDFGCGLIRPGHDSFRPLQAPAGTDLAALTEWNYFSSHTSELLNLINVDQFKSRYARHVAPIPV